MTYKITIKKVAIKAIENINDPFYSNIKIAIYDLAHDPRPMGYKKLKGSEAYRIRVGDYRIIYNIFDDMLIVDIIQLGNRKDIYN